ncbi:MAG: hypothetical protein CGU28_04475 [Candidatus Dactylopiibacterium carminicum]|uniref:DUF2318 domain-containing protein n=1 Tax=Candidatus Dactylopiibacterium carminicum TaxID=857335 RepID=A0A272EY82_9RHOO|nr:Fe-S-containing protein [Candidatus Dactylopiibacterium carminicum]KAF7600030.1 DUF2318 domain-containing protein [Candidatus Dactylopiibacterium carminicum]PAS94580.1 MAG: hypothetical protein CGU29_03365 [Candidatus Dactylopiibacterium carminicum]PAS97620.1 MAG: hypothetical protein CGU28_04475 [Candidatus Dactylopiibacterium carminicum]PAT00034.1 MAG: hypothetical protein BSR46_04655 [Candidatus Dactylopiibacterium carminicum]
MSYYWASILPAFLPTALLLAAHWAARPSCGPWSLLLTSMGALLAGIGLSFALPASQFAALGLGIAQFVLLAGFLLWQFTARREFFWQIALILLAGLLWGRSPVLASLSTAVINTDFIVNLASIVTAFAACLLLGWLTSRLLRELPRGRWPLLLAAGALLLVPLSGNILLSLMKLQALELTRARLSFAARTIDLETGAAYGALLLVGLLVAVAVVRLALPRRQAWQAAQPLIARRIAQATYRQTQRLLGALALVLVTMGGVHAYWDLVASRPPALSAATRVEIPADDELRLALAPMMDGNLHRFAWVADDGKVVRFFVINRLEDRASPSVVMDACLLCGDKGYVQQGDQIVCVGCGVHLFKPSIGKPGGCNPVPVENWRVEGGEIVIPKASLEAGLPLFSTVLTIEVTDPVSGRKLTNTSAAFHYVYAGKTYFFADEAALEAFRDDPEKYLPEDKAAEPAAQGAAP